MTIQDSVFFEGEGDRWFERNKEALGKPDKVDWPSHLIDLLKTKDSIKTILELGCANGYRLAKLKMKMPEACRVVGVDASAEAVADGKKQFAGVEFHHGTLSDIPLREEFDLVIINFVLHWVDRSTLAHSIAQIDRVVRDGGTLILGDFLPDFPQRRNYHHLEGGNVFTYKQDYAKTFEALGFYREFIRISFDHGTHQMLASPGESSSRGVCVALKKDVRGCYQEVL